MKVAVPKMTKGIKSPYEEKVIIPEVRKNTSLSPDGITTWAGRTCC